MNFLVRSLCLSVSKRPFTAIENILSINSETDLFAQEQKRAVQTGFETVSNVSFLGNSDELKIVSVKGSLKETADPTFDAPSKRVVDTTGKTIRRTLGVQLAKHS